MRALVFDALVVFGVIVMTLGVIGIIRMPDIYTKLHGASKSVFLGVIVLAMSGMVVADGAIVARLILISLMLVVTTPVASHVIGRAASLVDQRVDTTNAIEEDGARSAADGRPGWHV
ncbi:MAG: monovalent cation/H(+) antiporter subunit G [Chloroflexia bacterium]|jgi:multicomponent Na+:H+ antiporter subunit G|nr:monovalent cation/H(+) antiporter subunit G [Chloroflexia bacterium]